MTKREETMCSDWDKEVEELEAKIMRRIRLSIALRVMLAVIALLLMLWVLAEAFDLFEYFPGRYEHREDIPEVVEGVFATPEPTYWDEQPWLGNDESVALRGERDVINLAHLEYGFARYHAEKSAFLDDGWTRVYQEFGINAYSVEGTSVTIEGFEFRYHLNVYQPFVFGSRPDVVFMADLAGDLWKAPLSVVHMESLSEVSGSLEVHISPNPGLTLSKGDM